MISKILNWIFSKLGMAERGKHLASGVIGLFVFRLFSMLSVFITGIFITRAIGTEVYGEYVYVFAWVQVLVVPAMLGLDNLVVKEIASCNSTESWSFFRGLLRRSTQGVLLTGFALALLATLVFTLLQPHIEAISSSLVIPFMVGMLMVPALAFLRVKQSITIGMDRVTWAQFGEMVLIPVVHLGLIAVVLFLLKKSITSLEVIQYNIVAILVAIVFAWSQTRRYIPSKVYSAQPEFKTREWLVGGLLMLLVSSIQMLNSRIDVIMVGSMLGAAEAGIYNTANRGSTIILYIFLAVNTSLSPLIASYHVKGEWSRMQSIAKKASRVSLAVAAVPTVLLILIGKWFLLLYRPEFIAGYHPLILMCVAEFVVVSFGSLLVLLIMTGHTKEAFYGTGLSALLNITFNYLLIPRFGMMGAAIALSTGHLVSAFLMSYFVRKRLKISPEAWSKSIA